MNFKSVLIIVFIYGTNLLYAQWIQTNGPFGLTCQDLLFDKSGNLFLATNNQIYKSIDQGESWHSLKISGDKIVQTNTQRILIRNRNKIYYTNNEGVTWDSLEFISPVQDFAETKDSVLYVLLKTNKLLKSTVLKRTFENVDLPVNSVYINYSQLLADKENNLYLNCVVNTSDGPVDSLRIKYGVGVLFSLRDNSKVWKISFKDQWFIYHVNIDDRNKVYVATAKGFFKSNDFGKTFFNMNLISFSYYSSFKDKQICVTGPGEIYSSQNNGITWDTTKINAFRVASLGNNQIIAAGTSAGLWKWNNGNVQLFNTGITSSTISELVVDGNKIYAVALNGGVFSSDDFGSNWKLLGFENFHFFSAAKDPHGSFYVGTVGLGLFRKRNTNSVWEKVDNGLPERSWIKKILVVSDSLILTGGPQGIYRTTNQAKNWILSFDNTGYAMISTQSGKIILGSVDKYYFSSNGGNTWKNAETNIGTIRCFAIDSKNNIYAGTLWSGISKSSDDGISWNKVLDKVWYTTSIAIDSEDNVYACTQDGIYQSRDGGKNWFLYPSNIFLTSPTCLAIDSENHLIIGTQGSGVYRSVNKITSIDDFTLSVPFTFSLSQNYPNPFNPSTTIKFSIHNSQFATLKVYDMLGREAAALVNEEKTPGNYEVKFNGSNLSSGVYFYRLQSGSFSETKKFVLMK